MYIYLEILGYEIVYTEKEVRVIITCNALGKQFSVGLTSITVLVASTPPTWITSRLVLLLEEASEVGAVLSGHMLAGMVSSAEKEIENERGIIISELSFIMEIYS